VVQGRFAGTTEEFVLIVDDEAEVLEVLAECAAKAGVPCKSTTSTVEAEQILAGAKPFLMLIDFRMPVEDGLTFFERMKKSYPALEAVLVTGNADKAAAMRSIKVGVLDVIEKPFKVSEIVKVISARREMRAEILAEEARALREISEGFVQEAGEILQGIDALVMELENSAGGDRHIVDNLYRRVHTIKGCARSIPNTEAIFQISHAWESMLSAFRDKKRVANSDDVDSMLLAADALRQSIQTLLTATPFRPDVEKLLALFAVPQEPTNLQDDDGIIWVEAPPSAVPASAGVGVPAPRVAGLNSVRPSVSDTSSVVTVQTQKIDSFMEVSGELVVLRNSMQSVLDGLIRDGAGVARSLKPLVKELSEITTRVQQEVLSIRRVRFDSITQSLQRTTREVARSLKKEIAFHVDGGETEIDREITKRLSAALVHLVRNSCDHGLETPEERLAAGKPREGKVAVRASVRNGFVEVSVCDDGRGLSREKILAKAIENKMIVSEKADRLSDADVYGLIFAPGFSTAKVVSEVSGRGVGMDVVRTEMEAVGGVVRIDSKQGVGSTFSVTIPEIRSVMVEKLVVFSVGEIKIALPMASVSTIFRFSEKSIVQHPTRAEIEFQDRLQPFLRPHDLFKSLAAQQSEDLPTSERMGVLVIHKNRRVVLEVKDIDKQIDAVVRPLDESTKNVNACKGIALLSEEELAYALSTEKLMEFVYKNSLHE
jgi:two-component system chemotaxis sensor kinase CheA